MTAILVTGGAGYIGSHTVLVLCDAGRDVVVVDDLSTGRRDAVDPRARLIVGNCGDPSLIAQIIEQYGISIIMHFAASIIITESITDPLGYYGNNTIHSFNLIKTAIEKGVKGFVLSSTAAVYGQPEISPSVETSPCMPISPYGASKRMVEMMLEDVHRAHGFAFAALRYFNVCGADAEGRVPSPLPKTTHLVRAACRTALRRQAVLSIFGDDYPTPDGTCVRDYIEVCDLAAAHLAALRRLETGRHCGIVNCGYGRGYSVLEIIEAVRRIAGWSISVKKEPRRHGDPPILVADTTRLHAILDWHPVNDDVDTMMKRALQWEAGDWTTPCRDLCAS